MKVLHIDTSANLAGNSRLLTRYLVDQLAADEIVVRDVAQENLPLMTAETLMRFYNHEQGSVANGDLLRHLTVSETLIAELVSADVVVLGVPMYNFGVPAYLKNWIDHVARRGQTFRYGENGPEGLIGYTRVYVVASSGGTPIGSAADHASSHLSQVFSFLGATSVDIIDANGSKGSPAQIIESGKNQIDGLVQKKIVDQNRAHQNLNEARVQSI